MHPAFKINLNLSVLNEMTTHCCVIFLQFVFLPSTQTGKEGVHFASFRTVLIHTVLALPSILVPVFSSQKCMHSDPIRLSIVHMLLRFVPFIKRGHTSVTSI